MFDIKFANLSFVKKKGKKKIGGKKEIGGLLWKK